MARKLNSDKLITALVADPAQVPNLKTRVGWMGKSSREGYWRLYFTLELNNYIEFRESDVVHTQSLETQLNSLGGTVVFLQREAELLHTRTTSTQAQAEWLSGDITLGHLRRASAGMLTSGGGGVQPLLPIWWILIGLAIVAGGTFLISDAVDCPGHGPSGGLCPTNLTHCC